MKKILIVGQYIPSFSNNSNNRFTFLSNMLIKNNCKVEIVTTNFSHGEKKHRSFEENKLNYEYKVTMLNEPGYKKNVSIKRMYSHHILAKNLKKYLNTKKEKPDVIYCAVPSLSFAKIAAKYAKKNNIRFIIDVQDLWPEAFKMVFKVPVIKDILFYPLQRQANYIYKQADDIIAVSGTYANRAAKVNKKHKNKLSVFLGTELEIFDKYKNEHKSKFDENKVKIAYIGTLGHSYNIKIIIEALKILKNRYNNLKFIIMGDGPLRTEFEEYAKKQEIDYEFTGRLDYPVMVGKLCNCDIAVNPISSGSAGSIINKVGDYAAAGLPIINTQENEEYRNLVEQYNVGFNCKNNDAKDVAEKLEILIKDENVRKELGQNNRKLAEEKFDRKKTYLDIVDLVKKDEEKN